VYDAMKVYLTAEGKSSNDRLIGMIFRLLSISGVPRNISQWRIMPGIFFREGIQEIQWRTEGRENGDLGAVAP
jgi:hypothetical protein